MITLKMGSYSNEEKQAIARYLTQAHISIIREKGCHLNGANCTSCTLRHVCSDLQAAAIYVNDTYYAPPAEQTDDC